MKRYLCLCMSLITACVLTQFAEAKTPKFDHIAIIIADDLGNDVLSCFEGDVDAPFTPNICNRLVGNGLVFDNAWANPTCSPTRSTIQTGRFAFRNGVFAPGVALSLDEETIAEVLDSQGLNFAEAVVGKWHLGGTNFGCPTANPIYPNDQGYDYFAGAYSNLGGSNFSWCRAIVDSQGATVGQCNDTDPTFPECNAQPYATLVHSNAAVDWLNAQAGKFFLWMAFNAPHSPWQVPPLNDPACGTSPCYTQTINPALNEGDSCNATGDQRECYNAMIEVMDNQIGRLLDTMPKDTLVIFIGDNGTPGQVADECLDGKAKFTVYEGGVNVPMIIYSEKLKLGGRSDALVNMADLFSTILELAGATVPTANQLDGVSLLPLITGQSAKVRDYVFTERRLETQTLYQWATKNTRYKVIRTPNASPEDIEFYDLDDPADCEEETDLYDDANPNLTAEQNNNFLDVQEFGRHVRGELPSCPGRRSCSNSYGDCRRKFPFQCTEIRLPDGGCTQSDGTLFQCKAGQSIWVRNCECEAITPGSLCVNEDQSWFCR